MIPSVPSSETSIDSVISPPLVNPSGMHVRKRNGSLEPVSVDKIIKAVTKNAKGLIHVDPIRVAVKTIGGLYDGSTTSDLDSLSIQTAAALIAEEPEYSKLAARLLHGAIQKDVQNQNIFSFSQSIDIGYQLGLISDVTHALVKANSRKLNNTIDNHHSDNFEFFGIRTVADRYLLRNPQTREVIETPQYFFMRVACGLSTDVVSAIQFYTLLASFDYMPSSPTLFNAGCARPQLSSCFLLDSPQDNIEAIYDKYKDVALLSKYAGGIGVAWHRIRSRGSHIKGTNGHSNGIVPWLKTLDSSVSAVDQGSRRRGACCVYLETWHADIEEFLELRDSTGDEGRRTHNINLANWIPDLFMKRVDEDGIWSLFDPAVAEHLTDLYGAKFETEYTRLETEGKFQRQIKARDLYAKMMRTLAETGNGWIEFKDSCNRKSNQTGKPENVIHLSNLCVAPETMILTRNGNVKIASKANQQVDIWNGSGWAPVTVRKTGTNVKLLRVTFNNGTTIECSPDHKFPVVASHKHNPFSMVPAHSLSAGNTLAKFSLPDGIRSGKWKPIRVLSVVDIGRIDDTYCFTEPMTGLGTFNGVVTGQCTEILEVTSESETAVCNIGSINLSRYVTNGQFDFNKLTATVTTAMRFLDHVIDINFYTIPTAKASNLKWRPVGLGIMGLQDVFFQLKLPFDSEPARQLSAQIQEEIYFAALSTSCSLAQELAPHPSFGQTKAATGILQFESWGVVPTDLDRWDALRTRIESHGLRNSLMIAIAPTATIASIVGCYECIEPQISNLFKRETMSGDFIQINKYLVDELKALGLWTEDMRNRLKSAEGSIQSIPEIPESIRQVYRTVWEVPMRALIDMAADRGAFIDQSQSLNLFIESPTIGKLSSMYMYAWKRGLKTTYYLRSRPASKIAKTTVPVTGTTAVSCSLENPESCEACQ